ncbi:MAG: HYR domain-containing protein [Saprospiraceae bacterium]
MMRLLPSFLLVLLLSSTHSLLAQDTIPPVIFCPGNMTINLSPGECETPAFFNVYATDNQSTPSITQIDGTGLTSGDDFPIGTTTLRFMAMDAASNSDTCEFNITIVEYTPPTPGLVCDNFLNISMPGNCQMWLWPESVLEGNYGCYDDFVVNVNNTGTNYIGLNYVGQTITYTVTNTETGNTCWGQALVEDKSGPLISGCDSVTILCIQDKRPVSEGGDVPDPTFQDCYAFTVNYIDMQTPGTCNDPYSAIIMRMWTATDILGNVSTCNQIITVQRISLSNLTPVCPSNKTVECVPGVTPNFSPSVTGYPTVVIQGVTHDITAGANSVCNITASYTDQTIPSNPNCAAYKIIRSWAVMDWCLPIDNITNPWRCTQVIEYMDTTPPVVVPPANMTVSANLPGCRARPIIPASTVTDCSSYTVFISTPVGPIVGNGGQVPSPGLTYGIHTITIKVTDGCGNSTSVNMTINVQDLTKPNAVCDAHTVVALDDTGYAYANASTFDDGSTDNCCLDHFEVARLTDNCSNPNNLTFDGIVEFCCTDVGQTVPVLMRAYDCHGNFNVCQVEVTVQDISGPNITCPPNVTLNCGQNYNDPNLVGEVVDDPADKGPLDGLASDNCNGTLMISSADLGQVSCGSGTISRSWTATDVAGTSSVCIQTITVLNNSVFTGNSIVWPVDKIVNGCNASTSPDSTGKPTLPPPSACYTLVSGYTDLLLTSVPDACRKILRTWSVIDWCQYNPQNPTGPGRWDHVQTIKIIDTSAPTFTTCANRTFCNFKADCSDLIPDLSVGATDNCTDSTQIYYTWQVDLNDDGIADPGYVTSGVGRNTTNLYPIGTHRISYSAFDGCGNVGFCNFLFTIEDCKNPTVICETGVIATIMQTGMVPVSVLALEDGFSSDNCSDYDDLQFSFSPFVNDTVRIFTCADLGANLVQVWATDEAGNQDYCETQIIIQDNMGACGGPIIVMNVNGAVANEQSEGVEDVSIELNGNMTSSTLTAQSGLYSFANVPTGYDYTVTPQLDQNPLNGVTTFDLLLLNRHILGVAPLDTPYKLIAADANKSGTVTVSDIVEIRKVILHIEPDFPNNTSWRFVDAAYNFPNPQDPFTPAFPEVCNINDLTANSPHPNFVAVKIGDLNGNAVPNQFAGANEDRTTGSDFVMTIQDKVIKAGETVTVDFEADLENMLAYQFTLNFDRNVLEFAGLVPGPKVAAENFGLSLLNEGAVTTSWYQLLAPPAQQQERQFSLIFKARGNGKLSTLLSLGSRFTKAESYGSDGLEHPVSLRFADLKNVTVAAQFELYQNVPNPFNGATVIGFQLPEASAASLTIFDVSGKMVKEIHGEFAKGYHEISIEEGGLPSRGVFYYRLETPGNTATKKMTLL